MVGCKRLPEQSRRPGNPISGRIVALADVFDALTHERPHEAAWSVADSVPEIRRLAGSQFDTAVVDAFNQLDADKLAGHTRTHPRPRLAAVS
jgi:HD-GYP domain-containing protein (c-di-GMP phosphodiesterase class II)